MPGINFESLQIPICAILLPKRAIESLKIPISGTLMIEKQTVILARPQWTARLSLNAI